MICTWKDYRSVTLRCFRCGGPVQASFQVRGLIYCPSCRQERRRESAHAANERARQKRLGRNGCAGTQH